MSEAIAVVTFPEFCEFESPGDRREKALACTASEALQAYILVDPDRRRFEVAVRGDAGLVWQSFGPGETVTTPYAVIDLDEYYDLLDRVATTS